MIGRSEEVMRKVGGQRERGERDTEGRNIVDRITTIG